MVKILKHNWQGVVLPDEQAIASGLANLLTTLKTNEHAEHQIGQLKFEANWDQDDPDLLHVQIIILGRRPEEEDNDDDA